MNVPVHFSRHFEFEQKLLSRCNFEGIGVETKFCPTAKQLDKQEKPIKQSFYYKSFICKINLDQGRILGQGQILSQGQILGQGNVQGHCQCLCVCVVASGFVSRALYEALCPSNC